MFNAAIGISYLLIFWLIANGLWATREAGRNVLGMATAAIFFTCGVHHGTHAVHLIAPSLGFDLTQGLAMRHAFGWEMAVWEAVGAAVALFYLSLRRSYGRLLNSPVMFEDSTRLNYEDQLERERFALAEAQAITRQGSWDIDLDTGNHTWSNEMGRIFGLTAVDADDPAWTPLAAVVAEDRPGVEAALTAALVGRGELDLACRIARRSDNHIRFVQSRGRTINDADGRPRRFVATIADITDAHAAELARLRSAWRSSVWSQLPPGASAPEPQPS